MYNSLVLPYFDYCSYVRIYCWKITMYKDF
jgi:hypothetical protein